MVKLSHLDSRGRARMVDVGHKPVTSRRAVASALVILDRQTLEQVWNGGLEKGDALAVARFAGIQGAKQTPSLIPLCHPLPLDRVAIELRLLPEVSAIRVFAEARTRAATGVEMEALTGAAVAALALIDMVKGMDRNAHVAEIKLEIKEGGSSGRWVREGHEDPFPQKRHADNEPSTERASPSRGKRGGRKGRNSLAPPTSGETGARDGAGDTGKHDKGSRGDVSAHQGRTGGQSRGQPSAQHSRRKRRGR